MRGVRILKASGQPLYPYLKPLRMKSFPVGFCFLLLLTGTRLQASHIRSVEIQALQQNCSSLTYTIVVVGYINYGTPVSFGGDGSLLSFGNGSSVVLPELVDIDTVDAVLKVGRVRFEVPVTFLTPGTYTISYTEANRNEGVLNFTGSGATVFYTEVSLLVEAGRCNSLPTLIVPPIDRACPGLAFYHAVGAVDRDGDSLSYGLSVPLAASNTVVTNYKLPNDIAFYSGVDYDQATEAHSGPPVFFIDPVTGLLTWDAPNAVGEYAVSIRIYEWRRSPNDSVWNLTGYVLRDMQIIVEDCMNRRPEMNVPHDVCVIAGTPVNVVLKGSDPDGNPVIMEAFSDIFSLNENPATVQNNGKLQSTSPPYDTASLTFSWKPACAHVREQPYSIVFKIADRPRSGPPLVRFQTLFVKVMAPAPAYERVTVNPVNKVLTLQWKSPECANTKAVQVWRRVARYSYDAPECATGMPKALRYQLLAELPGDAVRYTDAAIAVGAQYCYRIVSLVGDGKVPSRISLDTCLIPKPPEAPVITTVSVTKTNATTGHAVVRWTSPFALDKNQYPPPYTYKVYRSPGLANPDFVFIQGPLKDTVFTDTLNTYDLAYRYRIELYVPSLTPAPVDTSDAASSVFLSQQSNTKELSLAWDAETPWYNFTQAYPYHRIYRNETGADEPFTLLDSVEVNENGFIYTDLKARPDVVYYYKVLTRGSYGNPDLPHPLENFSQVLRATKPDTIPPCAPVAVMEAMDCRSFSCLGNNYANKITWSMPAQCTEDIETYQIFVSDDEVAYTPLARVNGNSFTHGGLPSMAKCYTVAAIDRAGNMSNQSQPVCNDNCGYVAFANVITPYNSDGRNDYFEAFTDAADGASCPRFVKSIGLKIYDRWGTQVFALDALPGKENNYVFWNGLDPAGKKVSSGVYFYSADVYFDMRDPKAQHRLVKGWVQVID